MNDNADEGVPIPEDPLTTSTVAESSTPLAQTTAAQPALLGSKQRVRWQSLSSVTTVNSTGEPAYHKVSLFGEPLKLD
jgi:hypothetical protein